MRSLSLALILLAVSAVSALPSHAACVHQAAGTTTNGIGAITPPLPAGIATNDILLLYLETAAQAITIPTPNGGTWSAVTNSPQTGGNTRLTVFWSRYNGTQGDPTTDDSGDHQLGRIIAYRGCKATGDPWNITSGNSEVGDTSLSATGATTTADNTLVVIISAISLFTVDFGGTWTNTDLGSVVLTNNFGTSDGDDGRIGVVTGTKAAAGAYGATTNTLDAAADKAMMTIALEPAATGCSGTRALLGVGC